MSPAVVAGVVALLALAGLSPWRGADRTAHRRMSGLASARDDATPEGGAAGWTRGTASPERLDVPCLLELVAAAVRSGAGVPRALEAVGAAVGGPDGRALGRTAAALRLGADWETAWTAAGSEPGRPRDPGRPGEPVGQRRCPPRLDVLRRSLRGAWVDGAAPGEALRAAATEHRHDRQATARTAAARLAVRLVLPLGLCYLPAFVLVGLVPVLLALGLDLMSG
ncbi:type II secretion system F family protein [Isoptericola croceus]|uniref:type II secretion system F family protein n=1 Tax=Isoptericola croceus TaxID=3031406 RepID=UPI0023F92CE8|nr:type II secretion system F family protein [Isoptericola croceus]